ncbi:MAG: hypothetical protein H6622_02710 [Halobacteriovoraceae bacterium]|nr:hypothetical protein [Halobacteriovoraceae bacterium]
MESNKKHPIDLEVSMKSTHQNDYLIKFSKTEHEIPVLAGVHLHSIYNPIKEAQKFIQTNLEIIKKNHKFLILGSGFGYHVRELIKVASEIHQTYQIVVVEPERRVLADCLRIYPNRDRNVAYFCEEKFEILFNDPIFIEFLTSHPSVIPHPASFNLHSEYFKNFLSFEAKNDVESISCKLKDSFLIEYLNTLEKDVELIEAIDQHFNSNQKLKSQDFFFQAFSKFVQNEGRYINE